HFNTTRRRQPLASRGDLVNLSPLRTPPSTANSIIDDVQDEPTPSPSSESVNPSNDANSIVDENSSHDCYFQRVFGFKTHNKEDEEGWKDFRVFSLIYTSNLPDQLCLFMKKHKIDYNKSSPMSKTQMPKTVLQMT